jgi:[ribosomal protein S5]-alanine N-acetyltransferase
MNSLPQIETDRLILRVPAPKDAPLMCRFVTENREHFAPWDPVHTEEYYTESYWIRVLEQGVDDVRLEKQLQFVLTLKESPEKMIGQCRFSNVIRGVFQAAFLGYGLDCRAVGKGYMQEGLTHAILYCFETLNLHRIMANCMPANQRSLRLLKKLGFVEEGFAQKYLFLAGEWQDHILTALVNPSWKSCKNNGSNQT